MLVSITWSFLQLGSIVFGVNVIAQIFDAKNNIQSKKAKILFYTLVGILYLANFSIPLLTDKQGRYDYYILSSHVPMFFIFNTTLKVNLVKYFFVFLSSVFLIFPASVVMFYLTSFLVYPYRLLLIPAYYLSLVVMLYVFDKLLKNGFQEIIKTKNPKSFIVLIMFPSLYYIATFFIGMFNTSTDTVSFQHGNFIRVLIWLLTFTGYLLIFKMSKAERVLQEEKQQQNLISLQLQSSLKQVEYLHKLQNSSAEYRHNMRHHISFIDSVLRKGDVDQALGYLSEASTELDNITPARFCENETINLLLCAFKEKINKANINFEVNVRSNKHITLPSTELINIISNGLENALNASLLLDETQQERLISIYIDIKQDNLLIEIENNFKGEVQFIDGVPISNEEGHGYGCRSIVSMAERRGGICSFNAVDNTFTLRVVIPLKKNMVNV